MGALCGRRSRKVSVDFAVFQPSSCSARQQKVLHAQRRQGSRVERGESASGDRFCFSLCFCLLSDKGFQPFQIMAPAWKRSKVIQLDDEQNALSRSLAAFEVELCQKKHRSVVHRAEAPQSSSADSSPAKSEKPFSPMITTGRQSREVVGSESSEEGVRAEQRPLAKAEDATDATPTDSSASRLEASSTHQGLKMAMEEYYFLRGAAFNAF